MQRLVELKEKQGITSGPGISDERSYLMTCRELDSHFHEILEKLYERQKNLFRPIISSSEDIVDFYKCFITFRRSSTTRVMELKLDSTYIDIINKWVQASNQNDVTGAQPMKHYYAQYELLLKPFLRYTNEM